MPLDIYDEMPKDMKKYITNYGWHFNKRAYEYATKHKLGVVEELVGHGIGTSLHEEPDVPNYGKYNTGIELKTGMTLAIEPMVNAGTKNVKVCSDGWTTITRDGKKSAHYEHSILITDEGYEILTKL